MLGGSLRYKKQAEMLGIKNIKFIPTSSDLYIIHKFLNTLDVYSHGRADGEQCSSSIIEGLSHHLPIISHFAPSMGQFEQIRDAGVVVRNSEEYACEMKKLIVDCDYKKIKSNNAKKIYETTYNVKSIMDEYIKLYKEIISN
jgi:glycosyltransferase involved in cell wall biosynthesis